jgi:hypothetical protein
MTEVCILAVEEGRVSGLGSSYRVNPDETGVKEEYPLVLEEVESAIYDENKFVPLLFSEVYPEIFGFKAVRLEKVEERIFRQEADTKI